MKKKPIYKKWWFWGILAIVLMLIGAQRTPRPAARQETAAAVTAAPRETPAPTPVPVPEATPAPEAEAAETEIRPEVKEFLDAYEAFMDEYAAFMVRYEAADAGDLAAMMTDYAAFMTRYADFSEKLDAMDESELTTAELAYYLEVTSRTSQKLLLAGG